MAKIKKYYYIERQLIEKVTALRHVPPAIWIPKMKSQIDHELLTGIINLQNETNPLLWLRKEHPDLITRVLLWMVVDRLKTLVQGTHYSQQLGLKTPDSAGEELSEKIEPLTQMDSINPTTVSPEILLSSLQKWKAIYQKEELGASLVRSFKDDLLQDLKELFLLPESINALQWIQDKYSDLAAMEALRYLIEQTRPSIQIFTEDGKKRFYPKKQIRLGGLIVSLAEIALGTQAFIVTLTTRIPEKLLAVSFFPGMQIAWEGVERIEDNLGTQYLIYHRLEEGEKWWWWHSKSLSLLCYPAFQPKATEIIITSKATSFEVIDLGSGEEYQILNQLQIGDLFWKWTIRR